MGLPKSKKKTLVAANFYHFFDTWPIDHADPKCSCRPSYLHIVLGFNKDALSPTAFSS